MDQNDSTGASGEAQGGQSFPGIDIYFALLIRYGDSNPIAPYANYDIPSGDVHIFNGHIEGEWRGGGPGYTYMIARYNISGLGEWFPVGSTVDVGSWSEAESNLYHHFAFDPAPATQWTINQLHVGHRRIVALPVSTFQDPQVSTRSVLIVGAKVIEQFSNDLSIPQSGKCPAAICHTRVFGQGDERFRHSSQLFGLGQGRTNLLVFEQRVGHVAEHRLAVR